MARNLQIRNKEIRDDRWKVEGDEGSPAPINAPEEPGLDHGDIPPPSRMEPAPGRHMEEGSGIYL